MPLGKGYTVEGQMTGAEVRNKFTHFWYLSLHFLKDVGGIQIDVFPEYDTKIDFIRDGRPLNIFETPRQLFIRSGSFIQMRSNATEQYVIKSSVAYVRL
jgi:hypothetical protein